MGDVTLAPVENSLELKDHAKKSRLDIYELDSIVTSLAGGSDVSITAGGGATLIGTDIDSGGKVRIAAENDVVLAAAQDIYSYERETKSGNWFRKKQTRESETRVTNTGTDISASGDIEVVSAAGNLVTAGSRFASTEGNVALKAVKGDIFAGTYIDIFRKTHESRKSYLGGLFSSNSRSLTDNRFATGTAALAGLDLTLVSGGDTTLVGTQLKAGGRLSVETGGDFSITAAISSMRKEYFSHRVGAITMTTITENSFKEIATPATLIAGGGIGFDIRGKASLTLYDYAGVDSKELRTLYPDELLKIAGLELIKKPLADEYFYDKKVALSPAFKAVLALVVSTFIAPGIVGAIAPNLSGAMLTAAEGFTSSLLVGTLDGAVSGRFDIGAILKDAAFAGATAGLTSAVNISDFVRLPKSMTNNLIPGFGNKQLTMAGILDAGLDGVISSGLSSAVYGTDFGSGVLNSVVTYIANGVAGAAISEISDKLGHGRPSLEKLVAKATVNCIAAEVTGADCAAGAIGSLVTELMVSGIDPSKVDVKDLRNRIKLVSAIAGYFTSGGKAQNVNAAVNAAVLDYDNNAAPLLLIIPVLIGLLTAADIALTVNDAYDLTKEGLACDAGDQAACDRVGEMAQQFAIETTVEATAGAIVPGSKVGMKIIAALRKSGNEKIVKAVDEAVDAARGPAKGNDTEFKGGTHKDTSQPAGDKLDSHHCPAKKCYAGAPLSSADGPAIKMKPEDHALTKSYGSSLKAQEYRQKQKVLLEQGKLMEAIQMDIDDIRSISGNKYDSAIAEMIEYAKTLNPQDFIPR
ncbi:hemagglutinin repeat-containing protein [Rhizobium oryzihabitans]|uniref:hemagglutinin repeat-containing protein n=1 Tax=Rhizobium oryzihabitans TaxID=2267833 RepID=UPI0009D3460B|nr:hemagglutinin repeat-containing protein [Rhizobium oryzihabitans]CUX53226.1 hypothetical protein AGR5A_Lc20184 [Agrobacterium genomosp. 5 str. CFBP 6626]